MGDNGLRRRPTNLSRHSAVARRGTRCEQIALAFEPYSSQIKASETPQNQVHGKQAGGFFIGFYRRADNWPQLSAGRSALGLVQSHGTITRDTLGKTSSLKKAVMAESERSPPIGLD
jgi:hypothetical protein